MTAVFDAKKIPEHEASERRRFARRVSALFLVLGLILSAIAVQVYRVVGDFVEASSCIFRNNCNYLVRSGPRVRHC